MSTLRGFGGLQPGSVRPLACAPGFMLSLKHCLKAGCLNCLGLSFWLPVGRPRNHSSIPGGNKRL